MFLSIDIGYFGKKLNLENNLLYEVGGLVKKSK